MTLTAQAWGHDGKTYNGKDMRRMLTHLATNGLDPLAGGFTRGFKVSAQSSPNGTVQVALGDALVLATGAGLTGVYGVWNDAALNSGTFTATGGTTRTDVLILRVTSGVPALEIVPGTAGAGTPAVTGDNYLILANIVLPPSTSNITNAMITDRRVFIGKWAQPWGLVPACLVTSTTGQSNIPVGSYVDVTNLSVATPSTFPANRKLRITAYAALNAPNANEIVVLAIRDGSNNVLQQVRRAHVAGSEMQDLTAVAFVTSTAGAVTYKASATKNGSGSGSTLAVAGPVQFIVVEDIGPAANPD